jgi:methionyl-tRNA formyltransferase
MKIVFMSGHKREATLRHLLEHGANIIAVIFTFGSKKKDKYTSVADVAKAHGLKIYYLKRKEVREVIKKLAPDILLSCGFSLILDKETIESVPFAINAHPALLPQYRGFHCGANILMNGENKTGITVHFIDEGIDCGDIILQKEIPLTSFDTPKSLQRKTYVEEGEIVMQSLELIKSEKYQRKKQDENLATLYEKLRTPEDSAIDCNKPLKELYNSIRACDSEDYPAFFEIEGQRIYIKLWRSNKNNSEEDML